MLKLTHDEISDPFSNSLVQKRPRRLEAIVDNPCIKGTGIVQVVSTVSLFVSSPTIGACRLLTVNTGSFRIDIVCDQNSDLVAACRGTFDSGTLFDGFFFIFLIRRLFEQLFKTNCLFNT